MDDKCREKVEADDSSDDRNNIGTGKLAAQPEVPSEHRRDKQHNNNGDLRQIRHAINLPAA